MQCSDCGYQLTPFEKECPRCKNFASKGTKSVKSEPIELSFDAPTNNPLTAEKPIVEDETSTHPAKRKGFSPILATFIGLLALSFCGLFSLKVAHDAGSAKAEAIERIKSEGTQQCIAGDQEGCNYAMDKLRDANEYDSAEFLKLHIIVSLTLSDEQSRYRDNGGATIAEYEGYSKSLYSYAVVLAGEGDANYKVLQQASSCARTLAEYGKSHGIRGRY